MGLAIFVDFGFVVWGAVGAGKSAGGNLGAARVNSCGPDLRGAFAFSVLGGARCGIGRVRTDVRQMAFRRYSPDQFRGCAALLIRFQSILKPLAVRPLVMLGQASLQVFCVHLLFTFAGLTLLGNATMLTAWQQVALLAATLGAMLLTAKIFSKSEAKVEKKGDSAPAEEIVNASPLATAAMLPVPAESRIQRSDKEVSAALWR